MPACWFSDAREGQRTERIPLDRGNVFRLRAFRALCYGELHLLAFGQGAETACIDCAVVNKHVAATVLSNEAKAFGLVKPLNVAGFSIGH